MMLDVFPHLASNHHVTRTGQTAGMKPQLVKVVKLINSLDIMSILDDPIKCLIRVPNTKGLGPSRHRVPFALADSTTVFL